MSDLYDRGERVLVRVGHGVHLEARVMLDTGGGGIIVSRGKPNTTKRVDRSAVREPSRRASKKLNEPVQAKRKSTSLKKLAIAQGPSGLCALMRQSSAPTKTEMVDGEWSVCGEWIQSRSAPKRGEPTCPTCRAMLKMEP